MKTVISGVAGFVGSHLAETLLKQGHHVTGIDDFSNGTYTNIANIYQNPEFHFVNCDISQAVKIDYIWEADVLFHLACAKNRLSDVDPLRCIETNVRQTYLIFDKAEKSGIKKVVHSSTGSIYGDYDLKTIDESSKPCPVSMYGIDKLAGESYPRLFDFKSVILRYYHVYGTRGSGVVNVFIERHKKHLPLQVTGDGTQIRCFTHVDDIVTANLTAPVGTWNVCSGIRVTINELLKIIENVSGYEATVEYIEPLKNDIMDYHVTSSLPIKWKKDLFTEIEKIWNES